MKGDGASSHHRTVMGFRAAIFMKKTVTATFIAIGLARTAARPAKPGTMSLMGMPFLGMKSTERTLVFKNKIVILTKGGFQYGKAYQKEQTWPNLQLP